MTFYLSSQEPFAFRKIPESKNRPFLLIADHASKRIPKSLDNLGLPEEEVSRHIGVDIGAERVTELLAEKLGAAAVLANYSRLVMDLDRNPNDPNFIPEVSDGTVIPGNQNLTLAERSARRVVLYDPYHQAITQELTSLERRHGRVALISIHSFTPQLRENGSLRPWHMGILWRHDQASASALHAYLQEHTDWVVGDNEPYSMHVHSCNTLRHHAENTGRPALMLEIRQDEIATEAGQNRYADILAGFLATYQPPYIGAEEDASSHALAVGAA